MGLVGTPSLCILVVHTFTYGGSEYRGNKGVSEPVIIVPVLLEVFEGFSDLILNLRGWVTLTDPVIFSIIQNQLHLPCILFSVHDHCGSDIVCGNHAIQ